MTRRSVLFGGAASLFAQWSARKNVLFVICDDLNHDLGCYGADVKSPHVDGLAARGVRFDRAYCQYPLCNPSRSSFLSGLRPSTTRVMDQQTVLRRKDPSVVFMPDHFLANGYFVGGAGKVFHHAKPNVAGFTEFDASESTSAGENAASKQRYDKPAGDRTPNWLAFRGSDEGMSDTNTATMVCEWMERAARGSKPFFLVAGLKKPHLPWAVPEKYFDLYPKVTVPKEPANQDIPKIALITELLDSAPPASRSEAMAAYRAATSYMDAQVGRMLQTLDRLKLRESTIVVLIGDNGFHLGDHALWSKNTLFERATRVPMMWAGPGIAKGVSPRTTELLDIYPTLVEMTGLPVPGRLEGKSITPLLRRPDAAWDRPARSIVSRDNAMGRTVRTERWRYVRWDGGVQASELYDHASDSGEFVNLAARPEHAATVKRLSAML
ncbi:MAG: sulfatase [Bryobacteraceae bacterium]|nr:sulfatase [Bryobacteraceae bacterium]